MTRPGTRNELGTVELMPARTMQQELDRQLATLQQLRYAETAGLSADGLQAMVDPLRGLVEDHPVEPGTIPLLLVVSSRLVPTTEAVARWSVRGKPGWTDMGDELAGFGPIEGVEVPTADVYLLLDVDTGAATLNVRPDDALPAVLGAGRTPLTVDEGVAVVTHFPRVFEQHNAFQALGWRAGNKRVPSFWLSKGAPRLGWCWAGNPHTWLGAASAARRLASDQGSR